MFSSIPKAQETASKKQTPLICSPFIEIKEIKIAHAIAQNALSVILENAPLCDLNFYITVKRADPTQLVGTFALLKENETLNIEEYLWVDPIKFAELCQREAIRKSLQEEACAQMTQPALDLIEAVNQNDFKSFKSLKKSPFLTIYPWLNIFYFALKCDRWTIANHIIKEYPSILNYSIKEKNPLLYAADHHSLQVLSCLFKRSPSLALESDTQGHSIVDYITSEWPLSFRETIVKVLKEIHTFTQKDTPKGICYKVSDGYKPAPYFPTDADKARAGDLIERYHQKFNPAESSPSSSPLTSAQPKTRLEIELGAQIKLLEEIAGQKMGIQSPRPTHAAPRHLLAQFNATEPHRNPSSHPLPMIRESSDPSSQPDSIAP